MDLNEVNADLEVEKKLLSALMLDGGSAIAQTADKLNAEDFYRPAHKTVYRALEALGDRGEPVDVILVMNELKRMGKLDMTGREYVLRLVDYEYTTARVPQYVDIIKHHAKIRRLIEIGRIMADNAHHERYGVEEIVAIAESDLTALQGGEIENVESATNVLLRTVKEIHDRKDGLTGLTSGFMGLNQVTGGLKKSDLIILAARPSMGKTALALNMATEAARDAQVLIFSLEMSKTQLALRMLTAQSQINATRLQHGKLAPDEWSAIYSALDELSSRKLYLDDTAGITLSELRTKARRMKREQGLDLIVIDYIQLMQGGKEYRGNRVQEVSQISRELKALARELDVPVLALSQLSRSVELRADKRPQLSDLRESGSIEQDADVVMFLYRDEYYNRDADTNAAELIIAKNRNGATKSVGLHFERDCLLFSDLTRPA